MLSTSLCGSSRQGQAMGGASGARAVGAREEEEQQQEEGVNGGGHEFEPRQGQTAGERSSILDGYQLECSEVDVVLHYDLPDSRQWKKRVWTKKSYPKKLFRWNTAEEILSYLISFDRHEEWTSTTVPQKPPSGTILFFHRKQTKNFRSDGYEWKTRRTTKAVREDRMKLKVGGYQLLYGCYAHSAPNPNFHRRSYWLIQNPDLIMVHYLELDCSDGFGTRASLGQPDEQSSMVDLEQSIEPSNWSLLTISDCNLCALLSMVQTPDAAKALLNQLGGVLDQNVQRSSTLEEAIELNNYGLPEDMYKDTRSRKFKSSSSCSTCTSSAAGGSGGSSSSGGGGGKRDMEPVLQAAMNSLTGDNHSQGESSQHSVGNKMAVDLSSLTRTSNNQTTTPSSSVSAAVSSSNSTLSNGSSQEPGILNVLSKSPHIIVCCQKQGSTSYILTLPTAGSNSPATGPIPLPPGRMILPSPTSSGGGQETSVSAVLANLIKKSSGRPLLLPKTLDVGGGGVKGGGGGKGHQNGLNSSSEVVKDYDAEKFSQFASILVNMDGMGGLQLNEGEREDTNHLQNRSRSHTGSISDAEFTDSFESVNSTNQMEADDGEPQEVMDFASIVSSAVAVDPNGDGSKGDQMTGDIALLPEVPMSWLSVPTTGTGNQPNTTSDITMSTSSSTTTAVTTTPASGIVQDTATRGDMQPQPLPHPLPSVTQGNTQLSQLLPHSMPSVTRENTQLSQPLPLPLPSVTESSNLSVNSNSLPLLQESNGLNNFSHGHSSMGSGDTGAGDSQVQVSDQPMSGARTLEVGQTRHDSSYDFLDVSLDLDAESLQQLLSFSDPPEAHQRSTSNQQQSQPTIPADVADPSPLSPISQLFDSLEPPTSASPIDSNIPNLHPAHTVGSSSHQISGLGSGAAVIQVSHDIQSTSASTAVGVAVGGGATPQSLVPASGGGAVITSSSWAPSPNSLQLWLESTADAYEEGVLPSTSSKSTSTVLASSHPQPQAMDIDGSSGLTSVDLPQDLCDFITQSNLPRLSTSAQSTQSQPQYTQLQSNLQGSNLAFEGQNAFHSHSSSLSECDFNNSHVSDPNQGALFDSTADFPGPFDMFQPHPDPSLCSYQGEASSTHSQVQRKTSNTSIRSEPLSFDSLQVPPTMFGMSDSTYHRLSLPNLTTYDMNNDQGQSSLSLEPPSQATAASPVTSGSGGFTSSPCSHRSLSPGVALPDIPEGVQLPSHSPLAQFDPSQFNVDMLQYRTSSPVPSSPSIASVSSRSTISTQEFFDGESPSILELCEMMSESPNVRHQDFSHLVLSESEQQQLFRSAQVIQNAFRQYKSRRQMRDREKNAALLIENYYKNYVQMKHEKDKAARRIQQQYRIYKSRTKELNRAAIFIQQMYRYQKHRRHPAITPQASTSYSPLNIVNRTAQPPQSDPP